MIERLLSVRLARGKKSVLLLGPRQVGKSTLTRTLKPVRVVNLADEALYLAYAKDPGLLARQIATDPPRGAIVIDEVQRLPALLNSVQAMLDEGDQHRFILTGSSARKLRQRGVNLLPGRVILEHLDPLLYWEIADNFDLERILRVGALPGVYLDLEEGADTLSTYATVYLREEISAEATVRKVGSYARFLDFAAQANGGWINYAKFSSDSEINKETVRRFFTILDDTLLTFRIPPYRPAQSTRRLNQRERFIFFDPGVRNAILNIHQRTPTATEYGPLFEQWFILQCIGYARVYRQAWRWSAYRSQAGVEVDFILDVGDKLVAIECKWATTITERLCGGLRSFVQLADKPVECFIVSRASQRQRFSQGEISLNFRDFFLEILPALRAHQ